MTTTKEAWARTSRDNQPTKLGATSRPTEHLLRILRARIERGTPFDLARRACGVTDSAHDAWTERGLAMHDARPDRTYAQDPERVVIDGSLEPEAEYVRIMSTLQAGAAATLVESLWHIALDKGRKRDQLEAIKLLLRGMGEKSFDPRTEQDVQVTSIDDRGARDQARIDAMTDDERAALREAARAMDAKLAELDATMTAAAARPAVAAESSE